MNGSTSFLTEEEIKSLGFKKYGDNLKISRFAHFYTPSTIEIGNNVRIDDFCILSGNIKLGSNIHISAYCALYGAYGITMCDNTGLSPRATIFSSMDDFSGDFLIGPIHDKSKINVQGGSVLLEEYVQIGSGSILFPKLKISKGCVVGAMSLVNKSLDEWGVYAGIPVKKIKERRRGLLNL